MEKQTFHLWGRREELRESFDAWEVASGGIWFDEVAESGLPIIASSDLHSLKHMNSWKTVLQCEASSGAILESIKRQELDFRFYTQPENNHAPIRNDSIPNV